MKKSRLILAALATLPLIGCTTAGPFVTSISSDGQGNLVVEKAMVKLNAFLGTVTNHSPTTTTIRLSEVGSTNDTMPEGGGR